MLRALIWDVDGTLAETERDGHRVAFNEAFEAQGLPWRWDVATYGELLRVAGGRERLLHDMAGRADAPPSLAERNDLADRLHRLKNSSYARLVAAGGIGLRPGVQRLIEACALAGMRQAIATTTSRGNVDALLDATLGRGWEDRFDAIVCAEDAPAKKPDPLVYRIALERLGVEACEVVAIEDSPNGLCAACAAGIATVVTQSEYFRDRAFAGVLDLPLAICDDLDSLIIVSDGVIASTAQRIDIAALDRMLVGHAVSRRH